MGNKSEHFDRTVLVTLRFDDDKNQVYSGRDNLRANGIRIRNDLTKKQRNELFRIKQHGKSGYLYKGRLHVFDKPSKGNEIRLKLKAKRNTDQGKSLDSELEYA